jgi:phospholipid-translocating ATPase
MVINYRGKELKYKLLNVLEFNSTRKRMSVIVETSKGQILLLTKGADSIIFPRLSNHSQNVKETEDFVN